MTKAIVFGGNGFIGSHVVDLLDGLGYDVTVFDRFSRKRTYTARVREVRGDIHDAGQVDKALVGMDEVFHFLSSTTPASSDAGAANDLEANVLPTVRLVEAAASRGVRRFVFASSGGTVYGTASPGPYKETSPLGPVSSYGIGKMSIEKYVELISAQSGLDHLILRIANPYGTRQRPDRLQGLIPIALRRTLNREHLVRLGDGSMVRDYIWMDDLLSRLASLLGAEPRHRVYNVGSGTGTTVNEVFGAIERVTGIPPVIESAPTPPSFVHSASLDVSRFADEFGPQATTSLETGIAKLWEEINREG